MATERAVELMEVQKERDALSERLEGTKEILAEPMKKMEEFGKMEAETTAELRKIKEGGVVRGAQPCGRSFW